MNLNDASSFSVSSKKVPAPFARNEIRTFHLKSMNVTLRQNGDFLRSTLHSHFMCFDTFFASREGWALGSERVGLRELSDVRFLMFLHFTSK